MAKDATYSVSDLLANSEALFGVKPEIIHGALHGVNKESYTIVELKGMIAKFKSRKVKE